MEGPLTPKTPYREGKPLAEIIPPDRRRVKLFALVLSSMIAGVALWVVGGFVLDLAGSSSGQKPPPATPGYAAGRISPSLLHGPESDLTMPPGTLAIIHVWLQGCQDCMPAFEAMRRLEDEGGLGVDIPIYNVAYGEADPTWAMRYGVRTNLAYDVGGASVVRPLGIGTFTTLVVDRDGTILLRDRPDRPGYRARVRAAVHADDPRGPALRTDPAAHDGSRLEAASIERVIAAHRSGLKRLCWERGSPGLTAASVTVTVTIGKDGAVISSAASGSDPTFSQCVQSEVARWRFPEKYGDLPTTVQIPFKFVRE